jgi:hypothetical protein
VPGGWWPVTQANGFEGSGGAVSMISLPAPFATNLPGPVPISLHDLIYLLESSSLQVSAASQYGYCGGASNVWADVMTDGTTMYQTDGYASFVYGNGTWHIYASTSGPGWSLTETSGANFTVTNSVFYPEAMNDVGGVIGANQQGAPVLWNAGNFTSLGLASAVDINNQGEIVGVGSDSTYPSGEGAMLDSGNYQSPTFLRHTLPTALQNQITGVLPLMISNTNALDGSFTILSNAFFSGTDGSTGWENFIWKRDSQMNWTFAQVQLPAGTSINEYITINSSGIIAAKGSPPGGQVTDPLLLVPVQINEVTSQNPAPGRPLTSASAAIVGEPITLSISGTNIIPGYNFITAYKWHVPNAIKNYNPFASGTAVNDPPVIQLQTSDLNASTTGTLYYPVVPQNSSSGSIATSGTESVSCDLTLSTGGTCTVIAPLRIVAPSVQITGSMPGPLNLSNTTSGTTAIGTFIDGGNSVLFTTEPSGVVTRSPGVTPPTGFTSGSAGWLQVLSDNVNATASGSHTNVLNQVNYNDHGFPYPGGQMQWILSGNSSDSSYDSPSWPADYPPQTELDRTFSAGMYYMWISNVPKSIWVPLGVIGWGFKGQIDWSPNEQQFDWGGTPSKSPIVNIMPPQEPSWANTSHL